MAAMGKRFLGSRDYQQLQCYIQTLTDVNQTSFAAFPRALLRLSPTLS